MPRSARKKAPCPKKDKVDRYHRQQDSGEVPQYRVRRAFGSHNEKMADDIGYGDRHYFTEYSFDPLPPPCEQQGDAQYYRGRARHEQIVGQGKSWKRLYSTRREEIRSVDETVVRVVGGVVVDRVYFPEVGIEHRVVGPFPQEPVPQAVPDGDTIVGFPGMRIGVMRKIIAGDVLSEYRG